jgi:hypothetical protein
VILKTTGGGWWIAEGSEPTVNRQEPGASIARGVLWLAQRPSTSPSCLLDVGGRRVMELQPGPNDVRRLSPGVYFADRPETGTAPGRGAAVVRQPFPEPLLP